MSYGTDPCDFRSPHAPGISLDVNHGQLSRADLEGMQKLGVYELRTEQRIELALDDCLSKIEEANPHVYWMVKTFTKAIAIWLDDTPGVGVSSGSDARFPGRTALINIHQFISRPALIADALVHEAIYAIFYFQEWLQPWVTDAAVYHGEGYHVISPWSGRALRPRQFMQACFVWFGLYNFWTNSSVRRVFGNDESATLSATARRGFYSVPLRDAISEWEPCTSPRLANALSELQALVLSTDFPAIARSAGDGERHSKGPSSSSHVA